jgi:hypothetical protein
MELGETEKDGRGQTASWLMRKLRLFNNSIFVSLKALTRLDHRLRRDDGRSRTVVIPAKAGIQGTSRLLPRISWG